MSQQERLRGKSAEARHGAAHGEVCPSLQPESKPEGVRPLSRHVGQRRNENKGYAAERCRTSCVPEAGVQ